MSGTRTESAPRTAVALYVALALHAVLLLLFLAATPQDAGGPIQGAGIALQLAGPAGVLDAPPAPAEIPAEGSPDRSSGSPPREPAASRAQAPVASTIRIEGASVVSAGIILPAHRSGVQGADTYPERLRRHLYRYRRALPEGVSDSPATALARGHAEVRLVVGADGLAGNLRLETSSGSDLLDQEALALVRRAQPLPPPPGGGSISVVVPVRIGR